tara:strand:+ start:9 stop:635 length:627 start_codon:yes stop_codon:yes gene_type:complete
MFNNYIGERNRFDIFATPLVVENNIYSLNSKELKFIKSRSLKKIDNNSISKDALVIENKELLKLRKKIDSCVNNYVKNDLFINDKVTRTQSWIAVNKKGESHHQHDHPNTFISAIFYVNCDSGDLILTKSVSPIQEGFNFNYSIIKHSNANTRKWIVPVKTGDLVIFPGHITHHSTTNENYEDRVILGVNYFIKGILGTSDNVDLIKI